jgi:hypothetical protein
MFEDCFDRFNLIFSNEYLLKHFMRINLPEDIALLFIAFSVIFKWNFKIQNGDYLGQYI